MFTSPWDNIEPTAPRAHLLGCGDLDAMSDVAGRAVTINGVELSASKLAELRGLEREMGFHLWRGFYWYDAKCGAFGRIGGPTAGFLPAGLSFGGEMPRACSGSGTACFINGRELHEVDRRSLERIRGALPRGRYVLDATGGLTCVAQRCDGHGSRPRGPRAA